MNWLAHVFLSENSIDYQLGNLLADPLKGKPWAGASASTQAGFAMHKIIDAYTDSHATVSQSKARLGKKGYLKGVVIDIVYDHLLLKHWQRYSALELDRFISDFHGNASAAIADYPAAPRAFVNGIICSHSLTRYGTFEGLASVFQRFDQRLSPRILAKDTTTRYLPVLHQEMDALGADFNDYFPQLVAHFKGHTAGALGHPWLK
ncbi:MAG: ACP phosphodiesterase [Leptolyngbyaceae cyanobacterium]